MFIDTVPEESAAGALAEFYQQQKSAWGFLRTSLRPSRLVLK